MTQEIETFESQKNAHMYTLAIPVINLYFNRMLLEK